MTVSIITIETPTLGDRTYLAHDGHVAVVVDPQRDIDRILAVADGAGVQITHVLETHVHNDYVTGGLALAGATGAVYAPGRDAEATRSTSPRGRCAGCSLRSARPGHVLVVENPAVLEVYAGRCGGRVPVVCTSGRPAQVAVDLLRGLGAPAVPG